MWRLSIPCYIRPTPISLTKYQFVVWAVSTNRKQYTQSSPQKQQGVTARRVRCAHQL